MRFVYNLVLALFLVLFGSVAVMAQDTTPPTAPTLQSVTAVSTTQLNLVWSASTDNVGVTGYEVWYREVSTGPDTHITTVPGNQTTYSNTGLPANWKRWYTVFARDAAGNRTVSNTMSGRTLASPTDATAPSVPIMQSVTAVSTTQLNLVWSASTDNVGVTGYKVYRSTDGVNSTLFTTLGNVTSYQNTGLSPNQKFWYAISALDAAGNESAKSSPLMSGRTLASPTDATAPSVPIMQSVTAVSTTQLNLVWSASTDNVGVTGYKVYRSTDGVNSTLFTTLGNVTSYQNTGLSPNQKFWYAISALDAAGNESAKSSPLMSGRTLAGDTVSPLVSITSPTSGSTVAGTVTITASASDNVGVVGVQFKVDGVNLGAEDRTAPYSVSWNTISSGNGSHTITAAVRDAAGNTAVAMITVTVAPASRDVYATWEKPSPLDPSLQGYCLYYVPNSSLYYPQLGTCQISVQGPDTLARMITGLPADTDFCFVATSLYNGPVESPVSNESCVLALY